jgi:hypothetical protein
MASIKPILKSQYHAALAMLEQAIDRCPETLWCVPANPNPFWHVAYHALFCTHMYLQVDEASFHPWDHHRDEYQFLGPMPWPPHRSPNIGQPYAKAEVLAYLGFCNALVDPAIEKLDMEASESGFSWYKMSKLEHQIVNLRHLQHHAGQLADRLRQNAGMGIDWIGSR